ncbi:MAG TPA: U32 family peptidase [Rhodoblastus sp.]|nr:U32 family peptidase [Rhodoblastus sp.]
MTVRLTLGPILFHWPAEKKLDFYARIADEAPIDTVYLGEVVCSKRTPFFESRYEEVADRLERAGKKVVMSSLGEVMLKRERDMAADFAAMEGREVEINDSTALFHASGRRAHRLGPLMNVYNEATLSYLAARGATHVAPPPEMPRAALAILAARARELNMGFEVQGFGRASLALSARCYHARAHERTKDNCLFVCEEDADGMTLKTLDGATFLAVNGIQTLSHAFVDLSGDIPDLVALGATDIRLSPHTLDMVAVARIFRDALDGRISAAEARRAMRGLDAPGPYANGFFHGRAGHLYIETAAGSPSH